MRCEGVKLSRSACFWYVITVFCTLVSVKKGTGDWKKKTSRRGAEDAEGRGKKKEYLSHNALFTNYNAETAKISI